MVIILNCVLSIVIIEYLQLDSNWLLVAQVLSNLIYRNYLGVKSKIFGYFYMFTLDYTKEDIVNALVCFIVLSYIYIKNGYFTHIISFITFPFIFVLYFYWIYQGMSGVIYDEDSSH